VYVFLCYFNLKYDHTIYPYIKQIIISFQYKREPFICQIDSTKQKVEKLIKEKVKHQLRALALKFQKI